MPCSDDRMCDGRARDAARADAKVRGLRIGATVARLWAGPKVGTVRLNGRRVAAARCRDQRRHRGVTVRVPKPREPPRRDDRDLAVLGFTAHASARGSGLRGREPRGARDAEHAHRLQAQAELLPAVGGGDVQGAEGPSPAHAGSARCGRCVNKRAAAGDDAPSASRKVSDGLDEVGLVLVVVRDERRDRLLVEALELGQVLAHRGQEQPRRRCPRRRASPSSPRVVAGRDVRGEQRLVARAVQVHKSLRRPARVDRART